MYCTWKNTKCRKSKTIISTLKNRPLDKFLYSRTMDAIEIVERGLSKIEDSATKDAAIQTTETTETAKEKQKDKGIHIIGLLLY